MTGAFYGRTIKEHFYSLGELDVDCLPCSFGYEDFHSCISHSGRFEIATGHDPALFNKAYVVGVPGGDAF